MVTLRCVKIFLFVFTLLVDSLQSQPAYADDEEPSDHPALVRRNFLRFGKRALYAGSGGAGDAADWASLASLDAMGVGDGGAKADDHSLSRRDYREFVRFGKRAWPLPPQVAAAAAFEKRAGRASRSQSGHAKPRSFLRFGKRDHEDTITSDNRVARVGGAGVGVDKRRDDYLRFGKKPQTPQDEEVLCVDFGLCTDEQLQNAMDKKSNDFLRFG